MLRTIQTLQDVVNWDLCTGCGACEYYCRSGAIQLVNIATRGIRPEFKTACTECSACLNICPGANVDSPLMDATVPRSEYEETEFGLVLEVWEGYATDPTVRFRGSSGGVLSALSLYCLEKEGMTSVLQSGYSDGAVWDLKPLQSVTRDEVLTNAGSRYAPAAPCSALDQIEKSDGPCVFVGKPCDCAATSMLRKERPSLNSNLGLVLTFFCAGTPATQGTVDLVKKMGVDPTSIRSLRYRGDGWPGEFSVSTENGPSAPPMSYETSWSHLTGYRPLRCNICPDGLGRVADISCGDAWHRFKDDHDMGRSLVLVRTPRGREILHRAIRAGYVTLTRTTPHAVLAAQDSLLRRKRELFGRLLAMRSLLIPIPQFLNFRLTRAWMALPILRRVQTIAGTLRRALIRGWWRRRSVFVEHSSR